MQFPRSRIAFLLLLFTCVFFQQIVTAQTSDDAAYKEERQKAINLYNADKKLEALPVFEDLAKQNPKDHEVLVALAVCLVAHSATLQDQDAAAKEHLRARDILLKAKELGDTSTLMSNLLDTLQGMSDSGQIKFSDKPAIDQAFRDAEAAFAKRDFPEAIKGYSKALELDPENYHAALFIGDSYFAAGDYPKAGEWYEQASKFDPNNETAYRYYADMLTKSGEMEKARTKAIQAVVAEPYNAIPWRGLQQWATANKVQLVRVFLKVPDSVSKKDEKNITITLAPGQPVDIGVFWMVYSIIKAGWRGDKFKSNFPSEKQYRHSLAEEADALSAVAVQLNAKDAKKTPAASDPDLTLLLKLYQAGMLEPYILLNGADAGIAQDYAAYREKNRAKLEEYLGTFVVPPAPAKH